MMAELPLCPFCGSQVRLSRSSNFTICQSCGANAPSIAWNRRTPPSTAGWLPISSYDPKTSPDICLVAYECGHVTAAEYTEHLVGGPDDHMTWEAHIPPKDEKGEYRFFDAWPVAWMPYPAPPAPSQEGAAEGEG